MSAGTARALSRTQGDATSAAPACSRDVAPDSMRSRFVVLMGAHMRTAWLEGPRSCRPSWRSMQLPKRRVRRLALWVALLASALLTACQTAPTPPTQPDPDPTPATACVDGTAQATAESLGMPGWVVSRYDANEDDGGGCYTVHELQATENLARIHSEGLVEPATLERVVSVYGGAGPLIANAIDMTYQGWLEDRAAYLAAGQVPPAFFSHDQLAVIDPEGFIGETGLPSRIDPSVTIFPRSELLLSLTLADWIQGEENAAYLELFNETECEVGTESGDVQSSFDLRLDPEVRVGEDIEYRNGFAGELRLTYRRVRDRYTGWGETYDDGGLRLIHDVHPDDRSLIDLPNVTILAVHASPESYDGSFTVEELPAVGTTYGPGESLGVSVLRYNPFGPIADVSIIPGNISEGGWIDIGIGPGTYYDGELAVRVIDPFAWKYYPEGLRFAPKNIDRQLEPASYVMFCD